MGQPRKYGVIKDSATATKFISDLNASGEVAVGLASSYANEEDQAAAWNGLVSQGTVNEAVSASAQAFMLSQLTLTAANVAGQQSGDQVLRLADDIYMVIQPFNVSAEIPVTRIYIKHSSTVTTVCDLGSPGSNTFAPAVAYEITSTAEGDVLVKLAWCTEDCPTTEKHLKKIFACLNINCFTAKIESGELVIKAGSVQHTDSIFGAEGPCSGFVLHKMNNARNAGSAYGLTIFNRDGSPLYTWCGNSKPYSVVIDGNAPYVNIADHRETGLGRHIIEATDEYKPIKMAVFAPIFCPSVNDTAKTAKWIQQSPHDYSYFDNTGHIALSMGNQKSSVWLVDHGACLLDGTTSDYKTDNYSMPLSNPANIAVVNRPVIDNKIPFADEFSGYFDSSDGLSSSGWMNANGSVDMTFFGSPTVDVDSQNNQKYVRFAMSETVWSYGTMPYTIDLNHSESGTYIVDNSAGVEEVMIFVGRVSANGNGSLRSNVGGFCAPDYNRTAYGRVPRPGYLYYYFSDTYNEENLEAFTADGDGGSNAISYEFARQGIAGVRYIAVIRAERKQGNSYGKFNYDTYLDLDQASASYRHASGSFGEVSEPNASSTWSAVVAFNAVIGSGGTAFKKVDSYDNMNVEKFGSAPMTLTSDIYFFSVGHVDQDHYNSRITAQVNALKKKYFINDNNY